MLSGRQRHELEAVGVYDPNSPHAANRLKALELLINEGATVTDLKAHRDDLGLLDAGRVVGTPSRLRSSLARSLTSMPATSGRG
jgi:hypothetical protein